MTETITAAEMRAIEAEAMASGAVTGLQLMERAGQGVVEAIFDRWPELGTSTWAVVLCGPGNNGGDGFVIARLLAACGWEVHVFTVGNIENVPGDAFKNYERVAHLCRPLDMRNSGTMVPFFDLASAIHGLRRDPDAEHKPPFLVIDALFGLGLNRPLDAFAEVTAHWDKLHTFPDLDNARLVAVDIPSGLDSDTGEPLWSDAPFPALPAQLTVTFHLSKPAHVSEGAASWMGDVVVKDIGL